MKMVVAKTARDDTRVALALARSELERFKVSLDQLRLATHGQILALVKDKAEADSFFRPASVTPEEKPEKPANAKPAEAPPAKPAEGTQPSAPAPGKPSPS